MNQKEAFKTWFKAYSENYKGSALLTDPETVSEQAWLACMNWMQTRDFPENKVREMAAAFGKLPPDLTDTVVNTMRSGWDLALTDKFSYRGKS